MCNAQRDVQKGVNMQISKKTKETLKKLGRHIQYLAQKIFHTHFSTIQLFARYLFNSHPLPLSP